VISGEVGMRKPEAEIYLHAARVLGVAPAACVFVDDLGPNVRAAVAVGMIGVRHRDVQTTIEELAAIFDKPFR
jgi:HAD superfamily hydrolase (TIGR01509 family)